MQNSITDIEAEFNPYDDMVTRETIARMCAAIKYLGERANKKQLIRVFDGAFLDNAGKPLREGKVYICKPTYDLSFTSQVPTYADSEGQISNERPIPLDKDGKAIIWIEKDTDFDLEVYNWKGQIYSRQANLSTKEKSISEADLLKEIEEADNMTASKFKYLHNKYFGGEKC